ncbi:hypothetical protein VTO42DRAFT_3096 [Malbranchea cinnamomea]
MAETSVTSAVAFPDSDRDPSSPEASRKRRQSIRDDNDSKRRRLSAEVNQQLAPETSRRRSSIQSAAAPAPESEAKDSKASTTEADARRDKRKSGAEEERKRGQRLFGALLGTLSQSSTTPAQKRRADIERKQQAKLREQDAEYNEERKRRYEELMVARRREQRIYDRQAMELRHSNMLAMAHCLKTTAEPVLYYKPWQLRPEDEERIRNQIAETKSIIAREVEEFERRNPPAPETPKTHAPSSTEEVSREGTETGKAGETKEDDTKAVEKTETVGDDTNDNKDEKQLSHALPNVADATANETSPNTASNHDESKAAEASKTHEDEAEEVVLEDKEDTVIY